MNIYPFKFVIGSTVSVPIVPNELNFYSWLCSRVFGQELEKCRIKPGETKPITNDEVNVGGAAIKNTIRDTFSEYGKFPVGSALVVDIDLYSKATLRGKIHLIMLKELHDAVQNLSVKPSYIVILSEDSLPPGDLLLSAVNNIKKTGIKVVTVDENGFASGAEHVSEKEIREKRILSKEELANRIREKLIRQIGHFTKNDGSASVCLRHFYDGSRCIREIADYLWIKLHRIVGERSIVLCHSVRSPWLETAITSLWSKLSPCKVLMANEFVPVPDVDDIHIVVDFVDTGKTLLEYLIEKNIFPSSVIAILSTVNDDHETKESALGQEFTRVLKNADREVSIEYISTANYHRIGEMPCDLCKLPLAFESLPDVHPSTGIRSLDFWSMVLDSGVGIENDPPQYRVPENPIVNSVISANLIKGNGGFIAYKVDQLIHKLGLPPDLTIIYPEGNEGSGWYAYYLELILSLDSVPIPRSTINRFSHEKTGFTDSEKNQDWYRTLVKSPIRNCIVVDDLVFTGGSIRGMYKILSGLDKIAAAAVPFMYVNQHNNDIAIESFFPLYSLGVSKYVPELY
ncbi:MAG: hypothetical protein Q7U57_09150 [Methylovulum sp.]|nr:hypothetical protein [Methylovulum sp.]